jgi:RNA recognition motif-containing protein
MLLTYHSSGSFSSYRRYGFVRFQDVNEAQAAILALDGTCILGHTLQVKFADADAGPPTSISSSGLTPSDSCYAKHLPASYGIADVQQLFEAYGAVMDVKLFPCLDQFRGASALVRMASTEAAERAIQSLNNSSPPGCAQSLIVRFAESPAEKAARLSRRERQQQMLQRGVLQPSLAAGLGALDPMQIQQALAALSLNGLPLTAAGASMPGNGQAGVPRMPPAVGPAGAGLPPVYQAPVQSSICVKGLPPTADRLWVYENFARFGALVGMRILIDESTGLCNGTVFINFAEAVAAERARQAMNGMRSGEKILNVMVQQQAQLTGINGTNGTGPGAPQMLGDGYVPATMPMGVSPQATQAEWQQLLQQQSAAMQQGAMAW